MESPMDEILVGCSHGGPQLDMTEGEFTFAPTFMRGEEEMAATQCSCWRIRGWGAMIGCRL